MGVERNPIIGFETRTGVATFSASEADADYPASNLGVLPLNYVWRGATGTPGSLPDVDLKWTFGGAEYAVRTISLVRHNLSLDATFRLRLYSDDAWTSEIFDSDSADLLGDNEIWPQVYTDDELEWEDDNWFTAKYRSDQTRNRTWCRVIDLESLKLHKSGKVTITDEGNASGYRQVGYLDLARSHQFSRGIMMGTTRGVATNEVINQADAGETYVSDGRAKRIVRGGFQYLPRAEAENILGEMKARYMRKHPFIWHPFPREPKTWLLRSGLFRFDSLDPGQYALPVHDAEPISLVEV